MQRKDPMLPKSDELLQAEQDAANALDAYFHSGYGLQAMISRETGLAPPILSRMAKGRQPIPLEQAILIELASNGELRVETLCPSCAPLLVQFMLARAAKQST